MVRDTAPQEIIDLAEARAVARRARDWAAADTFRAQIEAAGWRGVDSGTLYDLERAAPADVEEDGLIRYGSSSSVPSRLGEPEEGTATVVMVATEWPADVQRAVGGFRAHSPAGTQLVVVANGASEDQAAALAGLAADDGVEVVWMAARVGHAAALNAGIRRAAAPVVLLVDTSIEPHGDLVGAVTEALRDPSVAVAGPFGIVSDDMRHFADPPEAAVDVDVIEGYALGFRRADYVDRGPLDEHFTFYRNLDIWWSLVLRDMPDDAAEDVRPRKARRTPGVRVDRHAHRGWTSLPEAERDRLSKKNLYRVLKRFATRRDLLLAGQG
jgi:cysteinyl-tRNA synthetase